MGEGIGPAVEGVAQTLIHSGIESRFKSRLPTRLTQANRSAGRKAELRREPRCWDRMAFAEGFDTADLK
jgi:hypothetical protein